MSDRRCSLNRSEIEGADGLVVVLALLVARRRVAVDEVVVEAERHRPDAVGEQLHGQPLREGRLARRARPGDEHDADAFPPSAAMRLAIRAMPASCSASATSDTSRIRSPAIASFSAPALRMPSRSSQSLACSNTANSFGYGVMGASSAGLALVRKLQHEPGRKRVQREVRQAAGRRHHVALEVVAPRRAGGTASASPGPDGPAGAPCRSRRATR